MSPRGTRHPGFTLLELILALTLGLIVSGAAIQIYLAGKRTYRLEEALSRVLEGGRFAVGMLGREFRHAGFVGCDSRRAKVKLENQSDTFVDVPGAVEIIRAYETGNGWTAPSGYSRFQQTDVVRLIHGAGSATHLAATMRSQSDALAPRVAFNGIRSDDTWLVTDCLTGDIFDHSGASGTALEPTHDLSRPYAVNSTLMRLRSRSYFCAVESGSERPALYRRDAGREPELLVHGVEDFQLSFGIDDDGESNDRYVDRYIDANAVTDWTRVASVKIDLTLASAADNVTADGQRFRRQFSTTVSLRNRLR